ncbi:MAG: hypothetical protein K6F60_09085, partial [Eubacterium sp.]|nr:hypothetical protein [Eubacterium sp.]
TYTTSVEESNLPYGDKYSGAPVREPGDNVGTYTINPDSVTVTNAENYDIEYKTDDFTITPKSVLVKPVDESKVYGEADPAFTYTVTSTSGHDKDDPLDSTVLKDIQISRELGELAGDYEMTASEKNPEADNKNYDIEFEPGNFKINQKPITITSGSASKHYDGTPLTDNTYEISGELVTGDSFYSVNISGTITEKGSTDNTIKDLIIHNGEGADVSDSYKITYVPGTLTIVSGKIKLIAASDSKEYDGTALENSSFTCVDAETGEGPGIATGETIIATVNGSQTLVGKSDNVINQNSVKIMNGNTDVTANYDISYEAGKLEVTKRALVITAGSGTREYDGTDYKITDFEADRLVVGHKVDSTSLIWSYTKKDSTDPADLTTIGTITNTVSGARIVDNSGKYVTEQYDITYASGESTITQKTDVTINTASSRKTYDGQVLSTDDYTLSGSLATGDRISTFASGTSPKNAGEYDNKPDTIVVVNGNGDDVTKNYKFGFDYGKIIIDKRPVTFTSIGATKIYDGTELTNPEVEVSGEGIIDSEDVTFTVTGSQTYVGESDNTFSYDIYSKDGTLHSVSANRLYSAFNGNLRRVFGITSNDPTEAEDNYSVTVIKEKLVVTDEGIITTTKTHEDKTYKLGDTITFEINVTNIYDSNKDITITEKSGVNFENGTNVIVLKNVPSGESRTVKATHIVTEEDISSGNGEYTNTVDVDFDGITTDHNATDKASIDKPNPSCKINFEIISKPEDGSSSYKVGETITYKLTLTNDGNQTLQIKDISNKFTRDDGSTIVLSDEALAILRSLIGKTIQLGKSTSVEFDYKLVDADKDTKLSHLINVTILTNYNDKSGAEEITQTLDADAEAISVAGSEDEPESIPAKEEKHTKKNTPSTADETPIAEAMLMLALSAAGIIVISRKKRKNIK